MIRKSHVEEPGLFHLALSTRYLRILVTVDLATISKFLVSPSINNHIQLTVYDEF